MRLDCRFPWTTALGCDESQLPQPVLLQGLWYAARSIRASTFHSSAALMFMHAAHYRPARCVTKTSRVVTAIANGAMLLVSRGDASCCYSANFVAELFRRCSRRKLVL